MNTRKKFLLQSSMATTALFLSKPFKTFANTIAPIGGFAENNSKVVLLHTGNNSNRVSNQAVAQVSDIKKSTGNVLLMHAGKNAGETIESLPYDASLYQYNSVLDALGNYRIIYKGDVKIGVITNTSGKKNYISENNTLAAYLKKEKGCALVVCLSQLGFKNEQGMDDIKLATASSDIDVIICGHSTNVPKSALIAQNGNREEVIIQSATGNGFALGNIEIGFNNRQQKNSIAINNLLTRV